MENPAQAHLSEWIQRQKDFEPESQNDDPNYWISNPQSLHADSHIESIAFGTGLSIYTHTILSAVAAAEQEIILVTCFWARSATLDALNETLVALSEKALRRGKKVRVRICLSSVSFFQRLFHTFSLQGRKYDPGQWKGVLGLPDPEELRGLEMEVKSVFVLPFSVMHPKFVIVDRKKVLLPSCNVSWENWFEGCVTLRGSEPGMIIPQFVQFWSRFWVRGEVLDKDANGNAFEAEETDVVTHTQPEFSTKPESCWWSMNRLQQNSGWTSSLFLPSPHHQNPRFSLLPWRPCPPPPPTPLNTFLLSAFANAKKYIYIQTPNLTSPPVLLALWRALEWGVDVTIVTSERLMILEQLVTAGTTTKQCINKLVKRHKRLLQRRHSSDWTGLEESGLTRPGRLQVLFFQPENRKIAPGAGEIAAEPTQSHLKLINIDDDWTIFGSGNMDRASWYTSQELGVAFWSQQSGEQPTEVARDVRGFLGEVMHKRKRLFYDGGVDEGYG